MRVDFGPLLESKRRFLMKTIWKRIAPYPIWTVFGVMAAIGTIVLLVLTPVTGEQVSSGLHGYQIVSHQVFLAAGERGTNVHVDCPAGKKVVGGGYDIETPDFVKVFSSEPTDGLGNFSDHGWNVFVRNDDTINSRQTTVSAICVGRDQRHDED